MLNHQLLDPPQLLGRETKVPRESDRLQPELCRQVVPINMDMRRLMGFVAIEVEAIRPAAQDSRLELSIPRRDRPGASAAEPVFLSPSAGYHTSHRRSRQEECLYQNQTRPARRRSKAASSTEVGNRFLAEAFLFEQIRQAPGRVDPVSHPRGDRGRPPLSRDRPLGV